MKRGIIVHLLSQVLVQRVLLHHLASEPLLFQGFDQGVLVELLGLDGDGRLLLAEIELNLLYSR